MPHRHLARIEKVRVTKVITLPQSREELVRRGHDSMLNDLRAVERSLASFGIATAARHPDIKDMAKGWALRVRLSETGQINSIEIVSEAGRGALWTLRDGQHNGFPGLKTTAPLLKLGQQEIEAHCDAWENDKTPTSHRTELTGLLTAHPVNAEQFAKWPNAGHRKRIKERLESLQVLANNQETASVPAAFERFLLALDASPSFLEQLTKALADRVRNGGDEWLDPAHAALIGPVALAIDADTNFPRDVCDPRQIEPVSAALNTAGTPEAEGSGDILCAFTGSTAKPHTGNFPQPNLPGLGQTYIFSRNRDIPSLTRYGRTADDSFPIDADLVQRLSGAITRLTREEVKDRTWRLIPAEKGDKPDLLIASIAAVPDANLAGPLADDNDDDAAGNESAWNELGARIIEQSRGILNQRTPQDEVLVLVLRTVDPANRKVVYHRSTSAIEFFKAAKLWQDAISNIPEWLGFRLPVKGTRQLVFRKPPDVSPLSITPLSRMQFANGGRRRVSVIGISVSDAFNLFLSDGNAEQRARRILRLLIERQSSLLGGLAAARTKGMDYLKDYDPKTDLRRDALRAVAWVGVLLHRLGRIREAYMSDTAFRLGQFLAVADVIHIGYCTDLRSGDVPPNLIGNSVLAVAGANPVRALSVLQSRLKPYLGWAKHSDAIFAKSAKEERDGSKGRAIALRQAVSHAHRAHEIASELHTMLGPYQAGRQKPDDVFRAELLLGYVAGLPPAKRADHDRSSIAEPNSQIENTGE